MKIIISLVFTASLVIVACKKNTDRACKADMPSIASSYKITGATYKASPSSPEIPYLDILFPEACRRDDIYTFQINGTYQIKDAGIVCSPAGDENGTWSIAGNTMVIDGASTSIQHFDCKILMIANMNIQTAGDMLTLTLTRQ